MGELDVPLVTTKLITPLRHNSDKQTCTSTTATWTSTVYVRLTTSEPHMPLSGHDLDF